METTQAPVVRTLGGHLALDFVNTWAGTRAPDAAHATYDDLAGWAVATGVLDAGEARRISTTARRHPDDAAAAVARADRIRDDLETIFGSLVDGRSPARAALGRVRDDASDALRHGRLEGAGRYDWTWRDDRTVDRPLRPIVHAAVRLLTDGPLDRLKRCDGCSYLFLDESKNRSRRWCSMDDCGTDEKVRRYVAARRARTAG